MWQCARENGIEMPKKRWFGCGTGLVGTGPALPDKFFDQSRVYKRSVYRHAGCDQSVKSLSYKTFLEEGRGKGAASDLHPKSSGRRPNSPTDVLNPD